MTTHGSNIYVHSNRLVRMDVIVVVLDGVKDHQRESETVGCPHGDGKDEHVLI